MNRIPVLLCGNAKVFDGMVICTLSIVKYHTGPIDLFLFTMDLRERDSAFAPVTEEQRDLLSDILRKTNPQSRVRLVDCKPYYLETLANAPNQNTQYTPYSFLRLYADRVPEMPPKLIYLDNSLRRHRRPVCNRPRARGVRRGARLLRLPLLRGQLPEFGRSAPESPPHPRNRALSPCARPLRPQKNFSCRPAINRLAKRKQVLPRRFNEQHRRRADTVVRHFSMAILWFPRFRTRNIKPWQIDEMHNTLGITEFDDILAEWQALTAPAQPE